MAELNLGPISLRCYSTSSWTHLTAAFVTHRQGGMAARETAVSAGFRSDHLLEVMGKDNPADTFECPDRGTLYFGRIMQTPTGVYAITAKEVYTKALFESALKDGLQKAESSTRIAA